MLVTYKNAFWRKGNTNGYIKETFTTEAKPITYKGFEIYKYSNIEFHVVKDGICISMRGSVENCKNAINGDTKYPLDLSLLN